MMVNWFAGPVIDVKGNIQLTEAVPNKRMVFIDNCLRRRPLFQCLIGNGCAMLVTTAHE